MNKLRSIYASAYAATLSTIVTVVLTLATDFSTSFKTWLANFTGHHWVTKSWVSIIVFVIAFVFFYFRNKNPEASQTRKSLRVLELAVIVGFVVIPAFFVYEFMK